jgi:8-oxo-dGTP pyrophosphatase MutT (NUDIX family)
MWLITNFGFFSIVQKPDDESAGTLTVRSRVRRDLEALRDRYLPEMGEIVVGGGTDYRYRAKISREALATAVGQIVRDIDYSNFKSSVSKQQGGDRAHAYLDVWKALLQLQENETTPCSPEPSTQTRRGTSYGGIVIDANQRILLREPADHFDGYVWTFPKGRPEPGETGEACALREVEEETGCRAEIIGRVPGTFRGGTGDNVYFLMRPASEGFEAALAHPAGTSETASTRWVNYDEARSLIVLTTNHVGRERDLKVLEAALSAYQQLQNERTAPRP